ncbi:CO or xanthine dehydrogenase, FAD-binding subunit [Pseudorhodobacter antarcticus]|uniref:CO or xanthine dehydrogenase, FAD-binding subunit n=1 Tax=Pseudorhodobacter antarcticus TaxID=1077947 RepID=A0A1H8L7Y4_9RHOB|nr:FAD binding domain-containing protein [Pseudorhodobacter antarcticus]SEO01223.1 CO or xanthine dehydrogenase, FAD-binding subunit [Pseudorhodobacter antarcticus]
MIYSAPTSVKDALAVLKSSQPRIVAGGTDFFPSQRAGAQDRNVLDLTRIEGLRGITRTASGWRIGAATTWTDIVKAVLPPAFDALKQSAREVGSIQIQNRGTLVGNVCNASPAADGLPPLLALNAEVEIASTDAPRRVPLSHFVTGVRKIDLAADELVAAIHIPAVPEDMTSAFVKLGSRKYMVISIVMVAANVRVQNGIIQQARVAGGACSPVAQRLPALEALVQGRAVADLVGLDFGDAALFAPLSPIADVRGSAIYRVRAVAQLCRRALIQAATGEK